MNLKELLETNPSWPGSLTDQQALDWLKESVTAWRDVPWLEHQIIMQAENVTRSILTTAAGNVTPSVAAAAQHLLDTVNAGRDVETSDSRVRTMLNASSMPTAYKTAMVAYAQLTVARWTEQSEFVGLDDASWLYHIAQARV